MQCHKCVPWCMTLRHMSVTFMIWTPELLLNFQLNYDFVTSLYGKVRTFVQVCTCVRSVACDAEHPLCSHPHAYWGCAPFVWSFPTSMPQLTWCCACALSVANGLWCWAPFMQSSSSLLGSRSLCMKLSNTNGSTRTKLEWGICYRIIYTADIFF